MTKPTRVRLLVLGACVAAPTVVVGVVLVTSSSPAQPTKQCRQLPRPLIVANAPSPHADLVRQAFRSSPTAAAITLDEVSADVSADPMFQFNYGIALFCAGYIQDAAQAWQTTKTAGRNTFYRMRADELLHPQYFQPADGLYPVFQPVGNNPLLARGTRLQREGREVSAEKLFSRAARAHPSDPETLVAVAIGRFDEANLTASLMPLFRLAKRFPKSQSVRFHLGLILAWIGQRTPAKAEFQAALAIDPKTSMGNQAALFLRGLTK